MARVEFSIQFFDSSPSGLAMLAVRFVAAFFCP